MAMKLASVYGGSTPDVVSEVNTTPLIDVMLVLLVMLIITIPMQLHAIGIDIAQGLPNPTAPEPTIHQIAIDFDGAMYWDDTLLANPTELDARLQDIGALAVADQPQVLIKPNRLADYGAVAAVMASVQRHGVRKMGVVGSDDPAR